MEYYLFTFHSSHDAIAAHKKLSDQMEAMIMPTLRQISKSCGISVRIQPEDVDTARRLLTDIDCALYHVQGSCVQRVED